LILYLDTSSLLKLYVEEEGSAQVRQLLEGAEVVATSVIAYAEARAALARHRRERAITPSEYQRAKTDFDRDWPAFLRIEVSEPLYRHAGDLAEHHAVRGFDSLHLAAFLSLEPGTGGKTVVFSSFDERLNEASRRESGSER
jgi:predicted nucleic acid-binding protein